ncbi:hypothetical protein [Vibrio gazogenes]|uniref:Uncharacterized protein n=1 Tax=Vibrio gazogenes DSM 21264 = NBRC 103151 TaxID=1123492 RepID=A0A1M4XY26_VIBGA|nr:hypothetical protein [Vibrio gazogenes]USP12844.1 hypothetical protein MKS89_10380 [Vibrio gazogenes]SHE98246.1 hypothetical protein SAMN02745781_01211 [Vibrio gazogenes DSM 21264] [Vibrio gazogenes DSM 21264 = NBRC 103151]SJN58834.1 hypothetical protein BQ6471_03209 [Vibrio gazogenes]
MRSNPMTKGKPRGEISNQEAPLPSALNELEMDEISSQILLQKKVRVLLYQEIPEILESLTTSQVIQLRKEFIQYIAECIIDIVDSEVGEIRLTNASVGAKLGWYVTETLLKVALNMASQSIGGIILDSLHEVLNTHGSSPFELNKQMKEVHFSDGSSGNVQTRHAQPWTAVNDINFDVFYRQLLSDIGDTAYADIEREVSKSLLGQIKDKMSTFFSWRDRTRNGLKFQTLTHESALERLLMPLEILSWRMTIVEQLINAVVFEEIAEVTKQKTAHDANYKPNLNDLKTGVRNAKQRMVRLNIHGYITYLNDIARSYIPRVNKRRLSTLILAETLLENSPNVLSHSQVFSNSFWQYLDKKKLIAKRKENALPSGTPRKDLQIYKLEMDKTYANKRTDDKLWKMVDESFRHRRLATTTSDNQFGPTSSLACFLAAELFVDENSENEKQIIKDVHQDSSYRAYTQFIDLDKSDRDFLENKQKTEELKLSIGVPSYLYPKKN